MKPHDTIDVLIGGYMSKDAAEEDYEAVLPCGGHLQGVALVAKDLEGNLSVEQTDHMVREGAGASARSGWRSWAGRAAAAGRHRDRGRAGRRHRQAASPQGRRQDREQAGETIPLGGAGLIVAYSRSEAEKVEPAVTRAVQKPVGEAEGGTSRP